MTFEELKHFIDPSSFGSIVVAAFAFLGVTTGTFGSNYLKYLKSKKELEINTNEGIIKYLNDRLDSERLLCEHNINVLSEEIKDYTVRMESLEKSIEFLKNEYIELPFPWWRRDSDGVFTHINKAALKKIFFPMGKTYKELIGCHPRNCLKPEFVSIIEKLDEEALLSSQSEAVIKNIKIDDTFHIYVIHKKIIATPIDYKIVSYECWAIIVNED